MTRSITTCLMFDGDAEAALELYSAAFPDCRVEEVERYGTQDADVEGRIKRAALTFHDQALLCFDTRVKHEFTFTPSISLAVECEDETELDAAFEKLAADGDVLMPPDDYGFSRKFTWLNDRFGVSWQLTLR